MVLGLDDWLSTKSAKALPQGEDLYRTGSVRAKASPFRARLQLSLNSGRCPELRLIAPWAICFANV